MYKNIRLPKMIFDYIIKRTNEDIFPQVLLHAQEWKTKIPSIIEYISESSKSRDMDGYLIVAKEVEREYLDSGDFWVGKKYGFHVGYLVSRKTFKRLKICKWCKKELTTDYHLYLHYVNILAVLDLLEIYNIKASFSFPREIIYKDEVIGVILVTTKTRGVLLDQIIVGVSINPPTNNESDGSRGAVRLFNAFDSGKAYTYFVGLVNKYFNVLLHVHHEGKDIIKLAIEHRCNFLKKKVLVEMMDGKTIEGYFVGLDRAVGLPIVEKDGELMVIPQVPRRISTISE